MALKETVFKNFLEVGDGPSENFPRPSFPHATLWTPSSRSSKSHANSAGSERDVNLGERCRQRLLESLEVPVGARVGLASLCELSSGFQCLTLTHVGSLSPAPLSSTNMRQS